MGEPDKYKTTNGGINYYPSDCLNYWRYSTIDKNGQRCGRLPAVYRVHWWQVVGSLILRTCLNAGSGPLVVCSLLLSAFLLCSRCIACKYGSISHFKGVFSGFWAFRVGLCCLGALRGFCARVELGGLKACGVFASLFVLLPFFFCSCVCLLLCWLSFFALVVFLCPLALSLWLFGCGCCFLFPFGLYAKRKGAPCWCVLSSCVVSVQNLVQFSKNSVAVALARSNSFG